MTSHGTGDLTRILLHPSCGRLHRGERTNQQRFYDHLNIAFFMLGYIRRGAYITKAENQCESERDYANIRPRPGLESVAITFDGVQPRI